eukprot:5248300-Amphidinium_carterae.1
MEPRRESTECGIETAAYVHAPMEANAFRNWISQCPRSPLCTFCQYSALSAKFRRSFKEGVCCLL